MIRKELSVEGGRLLDIGANWGYFCHKFEEIGFDCYAVEIERVNLYFLEKLKRAENRRFKIINKSIFEYQDIENSSFDVVLALNIFHHFLKDRASYYKLIDLLGKLKLGEMYFQPHCLGEPQMEGAYKNYSEEEFVKFILEASKLTKAELIGATQDGRKLYKLH
jgi:cyclopropane fatty-acyl-phospholipid synthase-like methyltransferase